MTGVRDRVAPDVLVLAGERFGRGQPNAVRGKYDCEYYYPIWCFWLACTLLAS